MLLPPASATGSLTKPFQQLGGWNSWKCQSVGGASSVTAATNGIYRWISRTFTFQSFQ